MHKSARLETARCGRWYLVHTQPHQERKAELNLCMQGFSTFLPEFEKTVRHARRLRTVRRPLFPRYLFVNFDIERERWLSIYSTFGVARLFAQDGRPLAVPRGIVEALLA